MSFLNLIFSRFICSIIINCMTQNMYAIKAAASGRFTAHA